MALRRIGASSLISNSSLNRDRKFISILEGCCRMGLVDLNCVDQIQNSIAFIFQDLILNYTARDSSSVKEETAFNLLCAIYYALDAYTAALDSPDDIVSHVREKGIKKIYAEGIELVRSCVEDSKSLFQEIANTKLDVPLEIYNELIEKDLPEFFRSYNIEFGAHDTAASFDYPLVFDDMKTEGIFYIKEYLEKLKLESQFCSCFRRHDILQFLRDYARKYHVVIIDTPINLFQILFDQSVFSIITGNQCGQLLVTRPLFTFLDKDLSVQEDHKLPGVITSAVNKMIRDFHIQSPFLIGYMQKYKQLFLDRVLHALENGNLLNLVIIDGENEDEGIYVFEDGERMSNERFTRLAELVLQCDDVKDKVKLIASSLHSIGDYQDLLEADCLFGDEFLPVFGALDEIGIAVLSRLVFYEELGYEKLQLSPHKLVDLKKNVESEWQSFFIDFLLRLDQNKRNNLEKMIHSIRTDGNE